MLLGDRIDTLGWIGEPTPVERLTALEDELGLDYLGVKRDDLCGALVGGTKARKLDVLLAEPAFRNAPGWHALGAIGSGQLVALCAAAQQLGRHLWAQCFWEPPGQQVLENLAFVASGPTSLRFHSSRTALAIKDPLLLLGKARNGAPVIAPGASAEAGIAGIAAAGLELSEQIRSGELPEPERVYVPMGSGGIAAGLSVGFALAGLRTTIHAIAVVERTLSPDWRLHQLQRRVIRWLRGRHVPGAGRCEPVPVRIDRSQLGSAYGVATAASSRVCETFQAYGLALEPIYSGKAMAALLADARRMRIPSRERRSRILFWVTPHRPGLPRTDDWQQRLPSALASRLQATETGSEPGSRPGRRIWIAGAGLGAGGALIWSRLSGYPPRPNWQGRVLSATEAQILDAIAEALLPPAPRGDRLYAVADKVDALLSRMPSWLHREVHRLLALLEHGTVLGLEVSRLTELEPEQRERFLAGLATREGVLRHAYKAVRALCFFAHYQQPQTWASLEYPGPLAGVNNGAAVPKRARWPAYERLVAPRGALPRAARR